MVLHWLTPAIKEQPCRSDLAWSAGRRADERRRLALEV